MQKIFLWFYCLPIWKAVLLILLATAAFCFLREKFRNTPCWKAGVMLLLFVWIVVILFATLGQRTEGSNLSKPALMPFASYLEVLKGGTKEILRSNFMNAVLFYPAGLLGGEMLPKGWKRSGKVALVTVLLALFSLGVEYAQYRLGLGIAETDDVIHNTLGTLLGGTAYAVIIKLHK